MKKLPLFFLLPTVRLLSWTWHDPWFLEPYSFEWETGFDYSYYSSVQGAVHNRSSSSELIYSDLDFGFSEDLQLGIELEVMRATDFPWGFESGALDAAYLWLDDVSGFDPLSLSTGVSFRGVPKRMRRNPNTPYHGSFGGEFYVSVGKEWSKEEYWTMHIWALASVGKGLGYPWSRFAGYFEMNWQDIHRCALFTRSYIGWGDSHQLDLKTFNGYAYLQHRLVDLGARYTYIFDVWGQISLEIVGSVYSKLYPLGMIRAEVNYSVPFSF